MPTLDLSSSLADLFSISSEVVVVVVLLFTAKIIFLLFLKKSKAPNNKKIITDKEDKEDKGDKLLKPEFLNTYRKNKDKPKTSKKKRVKNSTRLLHKNPKEITIDEYKKAYDEISFTVHNDNRVKDIYADGTIALSNEVSYDPLPTDTYSEYDKYMATENKNESDVFDVYKDGEYLNIPNYYEETDEEFNNYLDFVFDFDPMDDEEYEKLDEEYKKSIDKEKNLESNPYNYDLGDLEHHYRLEDFGIPVNNIKESNPYDYDLEVFEDESYFTYEGICDDDYDLKYNDTEDLAYEIVYEGWD